MTSRAYRSLQVDQITCEEFLALNPDDQQRIPYMPKRHLQHTSSIAARNGKNQEPASNTLSEAWCYRGYRPTVALCPGEADLQVT